MLRLFVLIFMSSFSITSQASDDLNLESYRQIAEGLLQSYDERARLVTELEPTVEQAYLPALPLRVSGALSSVERGLKVTIIAKQELLPATFSEEIKKIFAPISKNVSLNFLDVEAFPSRKAEDLKKPENQNPNLSGSFPQMSEIKNTLWLTLGGIGIFSLILLFLSIFFSTKASDKAAKKVAASLAGSRSETPSRKADAPARGSQHNENDRDLPFLNFESSSLAALLADCYWCEEDAMAAFVLAKVKPQNRRDLNLPFLADYTRFLAGVPPEYIDIDSDLSYLEPLGATHLGTEALLSLCKKSGGIYPYLSTLRRQSLGLSGADLVSVSRAEKIHPSKLAFINSLQASPLRELRILAKTYASSLDDDLSLLSDETVTQTEMLQIVSLVWAEKISEKALTALLRAFSARELADALDAPESTRKVLLKALPEQKRNLTLNYLSRSPASRQSLAYTDLYLSVCEALMSENSSNENQSTEYTEEKAA